MMCPECLELLQAQLDGQPVPDRALLEGHLAACPECRSWHRAADRLRLGLRLRTVPPPPPELANRIIATLRADHRRQLLTRYVSLGAAVAAALLVAVLLIPRPKQVDLPPPIAEKREEPEPVIASLEASVQEAGSAVARLTRQTADDTVGQARVLLPPVPLPSAPDLLWEDAVETPTQSLREAGQGVSVGLEPVATSARRAVALFLRELPMGSERQ